MFLRTCTALGLALAMAAPAMAQSADGSDIEPASLRPLTEDDAKVLIGAPLDTTASGAAGDVEADVEEVFVIERSNIKPSGEWTQADAQACKASGGIELEINLGRMVCIQL